MNLTKLYEAQRVLNERIIKDKGLEEKELLPSKILQLQVKLGDLADEWQGHKFWSEDQEPRTRRYVYCVACSGTGEQTGIDWKEAIDCRSCEGHGQHCVGNPLLEEYTGCLHSILSIGLEMFDREEHIITPDDIYYHFAKKHDNIIDHILSLMSDFTDLWNYEEIDYPYGIVITKFLKLGKALGFTWEEIEAEYFKTIGQAT